MTDSLLQCFDRFDKDKKILVIGDIFIDNYMYGVTERLSPERPVPVYIHRNTVNLCGGAANVACNIHELGLYVHTISVVGKDAAADSLQKMITSGNRLTSQLISDSTRVTSIKTRYVSGSQHLLRLDHETKNKLSKEMLSEVSNALDRLPWKPDVIVFSDYNKGVVTHELVDMVVDHPCAQGSALLADPKGTDWAKYNRVDIITPNKTEAELITGLSIDFAQQSEFLTMLATKTECKKILLKLGDHGMILCRSDHQPISIPAHIVDVSDTVGAGDSVIATMSAALASGLDLYSACRTANYVASLVVQKAATATVSIDDIKLSLRGVTNHQKIRYFSSSIGHPDQTRYLLGDRAKSNKTIGFTNGVFDLLHAGHLSLLEKAKSLCDFLVVGLNSDSSVRLLEKGSARPILPEEQRAYILSSIMFVDAVIVFDEKTPFDLIKTLKPDLIIKGNDYSIEQVVGSEFVARYGGRTVLVEHIFRQSTSEIIRKIKKITE